MKLKKLSAICALVPLPAAFGQVIYSIDFQHAGGLDTPGYIIADSGVDTLIHVVDPSVDLGGGVSLDFTGEYLSWFTNNAAEPLTTDGWAVLGDSSPAPDNIPFSVAIGTFTLSGLTPGDTVSMYALAAWDGPNRGPAIDFASTGIVDLSSASATPGASPLIPIDFATIATDVIVPASGSLSGALYETGAIEGQFGAFVFTVDSGLSTIPEPSIAAAFLGLSTLLCSIARRRR